MKLSIIILAITLVNCNGSSNREEELKKQEEVKERYAQYVERNPPKKDQKYPDILVAQCLTKKEFSNSEYSIFYDDIHCREQLALCKAPCDIQYNECERNNYFTRDRLACEDKNSRPCYKKCNEQFPCTEETNKKLADCLENNKE